MVYIKIIGRHSDVINVGGEKVYPAEVESVIQLMSNIQEVAVMGEAHPLTGQIIKAIIRLRTEEDITDFRVRLRSFCKDKLKSYKIPQKIVLTTQHLHGERFKKTRKEITEV